MLSFLICYRLLEFKKQINADEFRFLLTGGLALDEKLPEVPLKQTWISPKMWGEIYRLSKLENFKDLYMHFYDHLEEWKELYDSA